jgi:tRNA pseudouridine38-40 synthase
MSAAEPITTPSGARDRVVRLLVAYHGSSFHGFAANDGVSTVAGALTTALQRALRAPVELVGAGRTDAGVHAWGQVVSFSAAADTDLATLTRRVNAQTAPWLVVRRAEWAPPGFHARFSATWRRYRYTIVNREHPDPFHSDTTWHVQRPLSLVRLRLASDVLIGEHDFSSFCRRPKGQPDASMVRRVLEASWLDLDDGDPVNEGRLRFHITGTAFCHQMVRSLVGTLVEAGDGRRRPSDLGVALRARSRAAAGQVAPAHGLCLWEVGYDADPDGSLPFAP